MMGKTVLVLGVGLQGRAVVEDLERRSPVARIIAADRDVEALERCLAQLGARRTEARHLDARDEGALSALLSSGPDVVIDMLPAPFTKAVTRAAIDAGVHLVCTNYAHDYRHLDAEAAARDVTIMPEAGLDPGIDLVMAAHALTHFDVVESLLSYGGGMPAPECRDANPLHYKISWNFGGVLSSYHRPAKVIIGGREVTVAPDEIFEPRWTHEITFGDLGRLEAFINGNAAAFAHLLGIADTVRTTARYSCRWPGHCAFWRTLSKLGLLDDTAPAEGGPSPREFLRRHLEPWLQYADDERDMVLLRVEVAGSKGGVRLARRWDLVDYRDHATGLLAMNRTVGYPASIVAGMILDGQITRRGVGSPVRDVPPEPFFRALAERGITITETAVAPGDCHLPQ